MITGVLLWLGGFLLGFAAGVEVTTRLWRRARKVALERFVDDFTRAVRDNLDDPR